MSVANLEWPDAFKSGTISFLYLFVFGIISSVLIAVGDRIINGLSLTDDTSQILTLAVFTVAMVIFGIGALMSFIKVSASTIHKLEWIRALRFAIIGFIYACFWAIIVILVEISPELIRSTSDFLLETGIFIDFFKYTTGVINRTFSYYHDIIEIIGFVLTIIGIVASIIKVSIQSTENKINWRGAFGAALEALIYIVLLLTFVTMISLILGITITVMGGILGVFFTFDISSIQILDLPVGSYFNLLIELILYTIFILIGALIVILILTFMLKVTADTIRSLEWPTSYTHRKGFKERSIGVWKQFTEVKHGVVGLVIVIIFVIIALGAPIAYPLYPGVLARVGPDYAAPIWVRDITDPEAPPYKNYILDPTFEENDSWEFRSEGIRPWFGEVQVIPGYENDTRGSYEFDYSEGNFTEGTRSVKMTIIDGMETTPNIFYRHKTSVKANTSFAFNYSAPTWVTIKYDFKCIYSGSNPNYISPYAQIVTPEESPFPGYLARAEIEPPYHNIWKTYTRNISLLGYHYAFQKDNIVEIEFGLEWSNTIINPYNPPVPQNENGTAIAWFDNVRIIVHPSYYGLLGTTDAGQDVMSQLMWGAQVSLFIGLVATFIGVFVGLMVGLVSGYFGGYIDEILMRIVDFFLIMPGLPIMMILAALFSPSLEITTIIIALFAWPGVSRVIRSQVLVEKEKSYVEAAKAAGAGDVYLIFKHVFPNVLTLVFVQLATGVSGAILSEAALSFLALTPQGLVSWGRMLQAGYNAAALQNMAWWFVVPPGLMIVLLSMGFVFIGYATDKAMNPRQRKL
ncbi:MAG: ABC transporter permease subunit [Candidatus Hermodarchaeota archaeon]